MYFEVYTRDHGILKGSYVATLYNYHENINDACQNADLIIIHTEWNEFKQLNFKKITKKRNFKVFDMRNLYSTSEMKKNKINYFSIGR